MGAVYDVAIIGGGINGCGCAADAALRGLSVILCEKDDLASKTSSNSSKLIHGGLRYLEQFDFNFVKKALNERQTLLKLAPHLVHTLPFVLPYKKPLRPAWLLRIGLFIYDHLSHDNTLPHSQHIRRSKSSKYFSPLQDTFKQGMLFYDCATDDARLTVVNAMQAKEHGATILPRTELVHAEVINQLWHLTLKTKSEEIITIQAKALINAAGPWVEPINQLLQIPMQYNLSLVKGSHVLVPLLYPENHAYVLQHTDKRIVFVIPYHGYTMIGTTDVAFTGLREDVHIDSQEIEYLFSLVNQYFKISLHQHNIVHCWSGIRSLICDSGDKALKSLSRDYAYHFNSVPAPTITIYGGKITTYRQLAVQAINQLGSVFPDLAPSITNKFPLPGACCGAMDFQEYHQYATAKYHWVPSKCLERYLNTYGTCTELLLAGCQQIADLGRCYADNLYQVEINYLTHEEWATTWEDILWRRTKLGLEIDTATQQAWPNDPRAC